MYNQQHRFVAPTEHRRIPNPAFLDAVLTDDDGMADCMAACGCPASFPAHCFVQNEEPAEMADWYYSIVDAWCVLPPRIAALYQPKAEECITGCGDPVETRNDKVVGCLHGEDCHSIEMGCL